MSDNTDRSASMKQAELRQEAEKRLEGKVAQSPENLDVLTPAETQRLLHELRVHQIELELQNEELHRTQLELDVERARYFDLWDLAPVGYLTISETGLILQANLTAVRLLRAARSELVHRPFSRFIHKDDQDTYYLHYKELAQTGNSPGYELRMVKKDGAQFWAQLAASAVQDAGGAPVYRIVVNDISEGKQVEMNLARVQEELDEGLRAKIMMDERQRLALELHDTISQTLYGISLGARSALEVYSRDSAKAVEALNYVITLAKTGLQDLRAMIFELYPRSLETEGLVTVLTKQVIALRTRHGIEIEMLLCAEPDLSVPAKAVLYRIAQEALQNAVIHAHATHIEIILTIEPDAIRLEICDNGVGFDPQAHYPGHYGLISMQERAQIVGGVLEIHSQQACGTRVQVRLPIRPAQSGTRQPNL